MNRNDSLLEKIIKYIPGEVVAFYVFVSGLLIFDSQANPPHPDLVIFKYVVFAVIFGSMIWTFYAVLDKPIKELRKNETEKIKRARFHAIISGIAAIVWIYALGHPLLEFWITNDWGSVYYNAKIGSIVLAAFTTLVPLFERIFLGSPIRSN